MRSGYYVVEEYFSDRACPNCGGDMAPVQYYIANYDGTSSSVDARSLPNQVITTYTSRYSNIRPRTGGLCIACRVKEKQQIEKKHRNLAIGLGVGAICALSLFLWYVINLSPDFASKYRVLGFLGLIAAPVCGYFAVKHFMAAKRARKHWTTIVGSGVSRELQEEVRSTAFVSEGERLGFCRRNEVLLSLYQAKQLRS